MDITSTLGRAARTAVDRLGQWFALPGGTRVKGIFTAEPDTVLDVDTTNPLVTFHVDDIKGYGKGTIVYRVFNNQEYTLAHEHKTGSDYTRRFQLETVDI